MKDTSASVAISDYGQDLRPFRFVGPYPESEARDLVNRIHDGVRIDTILMDFAKGDIEPGELAYEIQCLFEAAERASKQKNDGADAAWKDRLERGGESA